MIGTIDCANQKRRRKYLLEKALATTRVKEAEGTGLECESQLSDAICQPQLASLWIDRGSDWAAVQWRVLSFDDSC
jgi:hypothetical protein